MEQVDADRPTGKFLHSGLRSRRESHVSRGQDLCVSKSQAGSRLNVLSLLELAHDLDGFGVAFTDYGKGSESLAKRESRGSRLEGTEYGISELGGGDWKVSSVEGNSRGQGSFVEAALEDGIGTSLGGSGQQGVHSGQVCIIGCSSEVVHRLGDSGSVLVGEGTIHSVTLKLQVCSARVTNGGLDILDSCSEGNGSESRAPESQLDTNAILDSMDPGCESGLVQGKRIRE
jgi:hypothetical protein